MQLRDDFPLSQKFAIAALLHVLEIEPLLEGVQIVENIRHDEVQEGPQLAKVVLVTGRSEVRPTAFGMSFGEVRLHVTGYPSTTIDLHFGTTSALESTCTSS